MLFSFFVYYRVKFSVLLYMYMNVDIEEIMSQLVFISEHMARKDDVAGVGSRVTQLRNELAQLGSRIEAIERHLGIAEEIVA